MVPRAPRVSFLLALTVVTGCELLRAVAPIANCPDNAYVEGGTCVRCPPGTGRAAGDDPLGPETACSPILCPTDTFVVEHACEACPPGTSSPGGDDASGDDTACLAEVCGQDRHVVGNACVPCPFGTTNAAGDDASGPDTDCDDGRCAENERVVDGACARCPLGEVSAAGADPDGADTGCCLPLWGALAGDADGRFARDFASDDDARWRATSIYEAGGDTAPGQAFWTRTTSGVSVGGFAATDVPFAFPSVDDGAAIFDSDFLDNGGEQAGEGEGPSPAPHHGTLTSPRLDLSAHDDARALTLELYGAARLEDVERLVVEVSFDDGESWTTAQDLQGERGLTSMTGERLSIALVNAAEEAALDAVRFRVVFEGAYYFAAIDDVSVLDCD